MPQQKIVWTPKALVSLQEVYHFLLRKWGEQIANNFLDIAEQRVSYITTYPHIALLIDRKGYRKLVIHKNTSIIYINEGSISSILLVVDNRQDPKELVKKLSQ